ncbi:MAG: hypothetical protein ABI556_17155, partial [Gemmatimonadales bacterium]
MIGRGAAVLTLALALAACTHAGVSPQPEDGLWDAHTHLSFYGPAALDSLKAHGVFAVRDLGAN